MGEKWEDGRRTSLWVGGRCEQGKRGVGGRWVVVSLIYLEELCLVYYYLLKYLYFSTWIVKVSVLGLI